MYFGIGGALGLVAPKNEAIACEYISIKPDFVGNGYFVGFALKLAHVELTTGVGSMGYS